MSASSPLILHPSPHPSPLEGRGSRKFSTLPRPLKILAQVLGLALLAGNRNVQLFQVLSHHLASVRDGVVGEEGVDLGLKLGRDERDDPLTHADDGHVRELLQHVVPAYEKEREWRLVIRFLHGFPILTKTLKLSVGDLQSLFRLRPPGDRLSESAKS